MSDRKRHKTKYPGVYYRERPDGSRQYIIWYVGTDGKGRFENVYGGEKDAVRARAKIIDRIAHGHKVAPTSTTFAEFAATWLEEQTGLKPKTISTYRWAIEQQLIPRLGVRLKLVDLDVNRVAAMVAEMRSEGKKAWTIRACLTPLSRIMATAVRRGLAPANPVPQLERSERPQGDQARMEILDSDEIKLLLDNATEWYKPLLATAIFTGLRIGELLNLKWSDIDWEEGVLHVRESKTRAGVREVVLMPALQQILATHSLDREGSVYVFETHEGQQMKHRTVTRRALEDTLKRAKISKRIRFHDLRHTFASILISHNYELTYIAEQMGHANPSITLRIYGHLLDRKKRRQEARERMEAAFGGVLS